MNIKQTKENESLTLFIEGSVDTVTAPTLMEHLKAELGGVKELVFDFKEVNYISSAGLRVLLFAQKTMNSQGHMEVRNVNDDIMETLELTGFVDILTIK